MPLPLINGTSCKRSGGNDAASRQRRAALHQKSALCKAPSHRALLWCRAALRCRMVWSCDTLQRRWLDLVDFNRHLYTGGRQFSVACWIGSWANLQHCCRHCTILNYSTSWWTSALCKWAFKTIGNHAAAAHIDLCKRSIGNGAARQRSVTLRSTKTVPCVKAP